MRRLPAFAILAVLAAAAPAAAQEDGCVAADPCPWEVDVDGGGFAGAGLEPSWNFTAGDWFTLTVFNLDDEAHTVRLVQEGEMVLASLIVPSLEERSSQPLQLAAGSYELRDQPSGDVAPVEAVPFDVVEGEGLAGEGADEPAAGDGGIPGVPIPLAALGILCAAALRKR